VNQQIKNINKIFYFFTNQIYQIEFQQSSVNLITFYGFFIDYCLYKESYAFLSGNVKYIHHILEIYDGKKVYYSYNGNKSLNLNIEELIEVIKQHNEYFIRT
jgi:hypothetical protein